MTKPRLLLAEDHELVGQGFVAVLSADYDVVATVTDGAKVVEEVARHQPDVLLLDLSLPNRNGIDLLPELGSACPGVRVLVVSMHVDPHLVDMTMKLGAAGFVPKNATMDELRTAIEEVRAGRKYLSPKLPKRAYHGSVADPIGFSRLTERQQKIVRMIGQGVNSEQIAEALGLTVWTVSFHRKNIRRALGIHNDMEMYRYAILVGSEGESSDS
ncbi:response regulator transcription factor [soil metagenome]